MHVYFDKCDVKINESGMVALGVRLSTENGLSPVYSVGRRGVVDQTPAGDLVSNLEMSYLVQPANEPNFVTVEHMKNLTGSILDPVVVSVGDLSGEFYIDSYSINAQPNEPIQASVSMTAYTELSGQLQEKNQVDTLDTGVAEIAHAWTTLLHNEQGDHRILPSYSFSYAFRANWVPNYTFNNRFPTQVDLMSADEQIQIERPDFSNVLFTGEELCYNLVDCSDTGHFKILELGILCGSSSGNVDSLHDTPDMRVINLSNAEISQKNLSVDVDNVARIVTTATKYF